MINVITLFSGYDSQCLALNRLGVEYDLVAWCEIDKYAIKAHDALFPQYADRNLGDISTVDWSAIKEPIDLLTYSSPCQDFSRAGLQRGGDEGSGTRSGLLWEVEKAIAALRPKYLVFENVPALVSDKFIGVFNKWQARLNEYGYTNFQQLMNAKDYGVPQNRVRIFMVSIRDCDRQYHFPKPFKLEKRLKDVLEQNVEERYYLKDEQVAKLLGGIDKQVNDTCIINRPHGYFNGDINKDYSPTIAATEAKVHKFVAEPQIIIIGTEGISPAVINGEKDGRPKIVEPTIYGLPHGHYEGDLYTDYAPTVKSSAYAANNPLIIPQATKEGYAVVPEGGVFDASYPDSTTRRGRVQEGGTVSPTIMASQNELLRYEGKLIDQVFLNGTVDGKCASTLTTGHDRARNITEPKGGHKQMGVKEIYNTGIRIRRLTERELYRLMDVEEKDIDTLLSAPIPRTQHAKLAGNSIVVSCLYHIFDRLLVHTEAQENEQLSLF